MNNIEDVDSQAPRILARVLAKETTVQDLEDSMGSGRPTWSLSFPPDHD